MTRTRSTTPTSSHPCDSIAADPSKPGQTTGPMCSSVSPDLTAELAMLPTLKGAVLRQRWTEITGRPAPRLGSMLLRHALAWEMQARVYGGLTRRIERRLAQDANTPGRHKSTAGMTLVREWKGVLHTVTIDSREVIHWNGKTWNSLTEVARTITGTRWSGPVFFGLNRKGHAA